MMPKRIILPLYFDCDNCSKKMSIPVPYVYDYTTKDDRSHIIDIYIKDRLDEKPNLCNCDGIYDKFIEEYKKMNFSFEAKH